MASGRKTKIRGYVLDAIKRKDIRHDDLKGLTEEVRTIQIKSGEEEHVVNGKAVWHHKKTLLDEKFIKTDADGFLRILLDPRDTADPRVLEAITSHINQEGREKISEEEKREGINDLKYICQSKVIDDRSLQFISKTLGSISFKPYEKDLLSCIAYQIKKRQGTTKSKTILSIFDEKLLEKLALDEEIYIDYRVMVAKFLEETLPKNQYLDLLLKTIINVEENWMTFRDMLLKSLDKYTTEEKLAFRENTYKSLLGEDNENNKKKLKDILEQTRKYL